MSRMAHTVWYLPALIRRLAADRRGVTAVVTGIALVAILGFAGLAIDVVSWLSATRGMQAAADQAAYSAALAAGTSVCPNNTKASAQAIAVAAARSFVNGVSNTTVTPSCPSSTTFKVTIAQPQQMWFASLFLAGAPTASASATATLAGKPSDLCILAIDGTNLSEGTTGNDASAFWLNGNTGVNVHCGVAVDSTNAAELSVGGSASLSAKDLYLLGPAYSTNGSGVVTTTPTAGNITYNAIAVEDPYATRVVPPYTCSSYSVTHLDSGTLDPAVQSVYCGGLSLGGSAPSTVTVKPGVYIIAGGSLTFNAKATITDNGAGVTFVLTGDSQHGYATITINGGPQSSVSLSAPPTGATGGMVFFQDRNAPFGGSASTTTSCGSGTSQNQINGGSSQTITGAIYFPNQSLCFSGGSSTNGANKCTQLIAHTLSFTGNSDIEANCAGVGVASMSVLTPQLIQ